MVWKYCTDLHFIQCKRELVYNSQRGRNEKWEQSRIKLKNIHVISENLRNRAARGARPAGSSFRSAYRASISEQSIHFMTVSGSSHLTSFEQFIFFSFNKSSGSWSWDRPAAPWSTFPFTLYTLVARDWTSDFWVWALSVEDMELIWPCMAFFRLSRHKHWERKRRSKKAYKNGLRQLLT